MDDSKMASMTLLALLLAAAGVIAWLVSPGSPLGADQDPAGIQTTTAPRDAATWSPRTAVTRQPWTVPGGLYHPLTAGQGRSALIEWGWEWISSPPGEAETGLARAG